MPGQALPVAPPAVMIAGTPAVRIVAVVPTSDIGLRIITVPFTINDVTRALEIAPANPARGYLLVQNNSASTMYLAFGRAATVDDLQLMPGGNYEPLRASTLSISVFSSAGGKGVLNQG